MIKATGTHGAVRPQALVLSQHPGGVQHPCGETSPPFPTHLSGQSSLPYPDLTAVISWCEQPAALPSARGRLLSFPGFPPLCHAGVCVLRVGCSGEPGAGLAVLWPRRSPRCTGPGPSPPTAAPCVEPSSNRQPRRSGTRRGANLGAPNTCGAPW